MKADVVLRVDHCAWPMGVSAPTWGTSAGRKKNPSIWRKLEWSRSTSANARLSWL